jgi:lipopolysaccharide transport protein LptA
VLWHAFGGNVVIHFSRGGDAPSIEPRYRVAAIVAGASLIAGTLIAGTLIAGTVAAQPPPISREPIVIDSVVATIDDTTNTADFTTISVTQGGARITAEKAHATDVGSKNSRWTFTGRVTITSEQRGSLWADQAVVVYRDGALDQIVATGAPVRFDQRRTGSEQADHGQAEEITYEAKQATVRLRGHPQISMGSGLEMNAPMFLYHVRTGRLQGYSDKGTQAVHIVTKPTGALVP